MIGLLLETLHLGSCHSLVQLSRESLKDRIAMARGMSSSDLAKVLLEKGFSGDIATAIEEHGIDGETFCEMTDTHLREIAPRIGDRVKLKQVQDSERCAANKVLLNQKSACHLCLPHIS